MNTARDYLHKLIDQIPSSDLSEVLDFVQYLRMKKEKQNFADLTEASNSSTEFWNNEIDDEVWNHA